MIKIKDFTEYQRNKNNFLNAVKGINAEKENERKNNYENIAMLDSSQRFRDQERDQIREYQQNKNDLNFNNKNNQNKFNNRNEQNRFENRQNEQNKKENDKNRNNNMK